MAKKTVVIIGGGPSGMLLADLLGKEFDVAIYEKEKTIGRKFLVAGNGGFNLTNALEGEDLIVKYHSNGMLDLPIKSFGSNKVREWLKDLGVPTFVGSSGRVFPEKGVKPIQVLEAIKKSLAAKGVKIFTGTKLIGVTKSRDLEIVREGKKGIVKSDFAVLALGGASWKNTGSDGSWVSILKNEGVRCNEFQSSNCGINIPWPESILNHYEGKPLKNIALTVNGFTVKGEALITKYGLEGNVVYPIVYEIRNLLNQGVSPDILIDFKPQNTIEQLKSKLAKSTDYRKKLNLNKTEQALLKGYTTKEVYLDSDKFVFKVKGLNIPVEGLRPVEEAISTVGGVTLDEVNSSFELKKIPNLYVIGEMLDWDTSTGGFLLQGCFSIAAWVAQAIQKSSRG